MTDTVQGTIIVRHLKGGITTQSIPARELARGSKIIARAVLIALSVTKPSQEIRIPKEDQELSPK